MKRSGAQDKGPGDDARRVEYGTQDHRRHAHGHDEKSPPEHNGLAVLPL